MSLGEIYERHHKERRNDGEFVFVPERIPLIKEAVGEGNKVLDLGCRSGALTQHFVEGNEVVGVDVDRAALAKAEERGITPVVADVEEPLPFPDESFDAVVAGELLEHLAFPETLVAEVERVLEPGGASSARCRTPSTSSVACASCAASRRSRIPRTCACSRASSCASSSRTSRTSSLTFVGGRYRPLHPRLLAQDMVFTAVRPAA